MYLKREREINTHEVITNLHEFLQDIDREKEERRGIFKRETGEREGWKAKEVGGRGELMTSSEEGRFQG